MSRAENFGLSDDKRWIHMHACAVPGCHEYAECDFPGEPETTEYGGTVLVFDRCSDVEQFCESHEGYRPCPECGEYVPASVGCQCAWDETDYAEQRADWAHDGKKEAA